MNRAGLMRVRYESGASARAEPLPGLGSQGRISPSYEGRPNHAHDRSIVFVYVWHPTHARGLWFPRTATETATGWQCAEARTEQTRWSYAVGCVGVEPTTYGLKVRCSAD